MNSSNQSKAGQQRVLALVTDAFGGYGGIAQYNRDLISALAETSDSIAIEVLPRMAPGALETMPRSVRQHPPVSGRVAYTISALACALRQRPTMVFNGHLYHGPLAHTIAKLTGAKLVSQLHGTEIWGDVSQKHRRPLEASSLVLTVSRDTRASLLNKADIVPEKVVVLNNTIGADFTPGDRTSARQRFGLTKELTILTVARLDAREGYKGHDKIIPLISQIASQGRQVCYLIAGIGDDRPRLERIAKDYGVERQVKFLGKVPREHLPDLYRASDLFALPSTGEGFGIAFLEAMACGTPAIGLAIGGSPDALKDGKLGDCLQAEDFAGAFLSALTKPRPSPEVLSAAVHSCFGFESFKAQCHRLLTIAS